MKRDLLQVLLLVFIILPSAQAEELRDATAFFDDSFGDLMEEAGTAAEEGKKALMIMFETDDCPWCKRMKERVLNRARVQDFFRENFRIITVNAEGGTLIVNFDGTELKEIDFAKLNRVRATPVFAFFDTDGNYLTRYTGTAKTVEEFMLLGEYVISGAYEEGRFSKYKRARLPKAG